MTKTNPLSDPIYSNLQLASLCLLVLSAGVIFGAQLQAQVYNAPLQDGSIVCYWNTTYQPVIEPFSVEGLNFTEVAIS